MRLGRSGVGGAAKRGKARQIIIDLLGWARGEFHRRRRYMKQEEAETERQAGEVLRALVEKSLERKETREQ